jgi:DNA-binding FadR family transcriptional regulator
MTATENPEDAATLGGSALAGPVLSGSAETRWMSRGERLARRLASAILSEELQEGQRLGTKAELRTQFNVAAGTLNEALRILQTQHLVEIRSGPPLSGGVFVATGRPAVRMRNAVMMLRRDTDSVQQALEIRHALDSLVAEQACRQAQAKDAAALWSIIADMEAQLDDPAAFIRCNWALHRRMAESTGNPVLMSVYLALSDLAAESFDDFAADDRFHKRKHETLDLHRRLVVAVLSGDPSLAVAAAREHTTVVQAVHSTGDGHKAHGAQS